MVQCPDCNLSMTQHTLKYIHKKRGYCKGAFQEESKTEATTEVKTFKEKEPPGLPKQKPTKLITNITYEIVNTYIKANPGTVTNYLRNERVMTTQGKQMHVRSLLTKCILK